MPVVQEQIKIITSGKGTTDFTKEVSRIISKSNIKNGTVTLFCRHTSASLLIMENADPSVRLDLENYLDRLVPERDPLYTHTFEGPDDMPAHVKTSFSSTSETVPLHDGKMVLGTWQGLYLWEFRSQSHSRMIWVTINGE